MTLQLRHIAFTDAATFMISSWWGFVESLDMGTLTGLFNP
jgi:hypothetical protein